MKKCETETLTNRGPRTGTVLVPITIFYFIQNFVILLVIEIVYYDSRNNCDFKIKNQTTNMRVIIKLVTVYHVLVQPTHNSNERGIFEITVCRYWSILVSLFVSVV